MAFRQKRNRQFNQKMLDAALYSEEQIGIYLARQRYIDYVQKITTRKPEADAKFAAETRLYEEHASVQTDQQPTNARLSVRVQENFALKQHASQLPLPLRAVTYRFPPYRRREPPMWQRRDI